MVGEWVVEAVAGFDPITVSVILSMAVATYVTKVGGLWILSRVTVSERLEAGLDVLPGAIVISILAPEIVGGGPATWGGSLAVLLGAWLTDSDLLALVVGVGGVLLLRGIA
jgi:uncharacterized membrane protein